MKRTLSLILALCFVFAGAFCVSPSAAEMPELKEYGFVDCNGVKIEYGIYGDMQGEPLLLLPPNGGDMHSFDGNILPEMSKHFKVIAVSPRGCGQSDRGEGRLTFEVMSDDLVYVLDYLKADKVNIFGFSDGGNLGFVFTVEHPERVKSLAVMGSNINTMGTKTFNQISIVWRYLGFWIKAAITKDPEDELRRDIQGMMVRQPTLTFDDIAKIKVPVLNIYGEDDMIKRSHSKRITASIEGAQELMVIGGGHGSCFDQTETLLNPTLLEFYNGVE